MTMTQHPSIEYMRCAVCGGASPRCGLPKQREAARAASNPRVFHVQYGIGKAKYVVNYHDGKKKHRDGSAFFDINIFSNKKKLAGFVSGLRAAGYTERGIYG